MSNKDNIKKMQGVVTRIERTCYFVRLDEIEGKPELMAYIGGHMRSKRINIVVGDIVTFEMDLQHPTAMGRIVYRGINKHAAAAAAAAANGSADGKPAVKTEKK